MSIDMCRICHKEPATDTTVFRALSSGVVVSHSTCERHTAGLKSDMEVAGWAVTSVVDEVVRAQAVFRSPQPVRTLILDTYAPERGEVDTARGQVTLTDFLLARIAEDELDAHVILDSRVTVRSGCRSAARVLAECEAKRKIIDAAWSDQERIEGEWGSGQSRAQMSVKDDNPETVAHLAAIYSDHPDYRSEWSA